VLKVTFVFPSTCDVVLAHNVLDRFFLKKFGMGDLIFSHIKSPKVCFMRTVNKLLYVYFELLIRCYEHTAGKTNKLQ
jgi:hypothetical protein